MKGTGNMTELQCPKAKRLFSPYLDGAVTGAEMLALQQHLSDCWECNEQYQSAAPDATIVGEREAS